MSFEQELLKFSQELHQKMQTTEQIVFQNLSTIEQECMNQSRDDVDRFVNCMNQATEKVQNEEKKFEFRMAFLQNETFNCFKNAEQQKQYEPCKENAKQNLDKYLNEFINQIKK
ncbi:hypothetical protein IMG5_171290 [Ichthyophthirius multifiliis]|uniref:Uncharacterized protein n=1 Tax=Ichthyophthirius multifiliis TaxID=5932 RepID=G0R1L7_ICHMU|nr:hypothetical protein IMG5_171290 [Ichthyophthirius multifiliis]EGR28646.1 hypothetical protein IMG5_171290 [Ichthyophthirius multifiliis]|eukprot:XP_004029882.1 hypothetical protein IMG5_171290 [Ichthyophthirius multifiliis]